MTRLLLVAFVVVLSAQGVSAGAEWYVYPDAGTPIQDAIDSLEEGIRSTCMRGRMPLCGDFNNNISKWVEKADTPSAGGYGEAIVGTKNIIYAVRNLYASSNPEFWRYDPSTDSWSSMSTSGLPLGAFRTGTALAWDNGSYIYAMPGARYSDFNRRIFYRYSIINNNWEQLADTPHAQGAGDAITWSGYDGYIYAIIGSAKHGTAFARYKYNSWEVLALNPNWTVTDDGASLVWAGCEYLYAQRGEYKETVPNGDFARYHIPSQTWVDMKNIPESEGVGDGGSLLWIVEYPDDIFALAGGDVYENPGYNFYSYSISTDSWGQLESIPCPIGYYVGNRLGFADGHIYYWQGSPTTAKWICGGDAFYSFVVKPSPPTNITVCPVGCNYTNIQAAINASSPGGTILVYSGTYYENVNVNKQVILRGIDTGGGKPAVNAGGSGNAINITADGTILEGFNATNSKNWPYAGIVVVSNSNTIRDNIISNSNFGICLTSSSNNTVSANYISNNNNGIWLFFDSSKNNKIFHNNLINNTNQAYDNSGGNSWDNGYPGGGNYWSDYTGIDLKSGSSQNISGSDGIGDTPYNISGCAGAQDRYPLMQPWIESGSEYISIGLASASTNSIITIPVSVANITNISGISFDLNYNSSVVIISNVSANESFVGSSITQNIDNVNGTTSIVLTNSNLISASAETPVIDITFNIAGGSGSSTSLDLQNVEFSDSEFNAYTPAVVEDGQITVGIKGDFNGNGRVDIGDVAKVAFMIAGKVTEDLNADFNGNGRVDIGDAAKIAFYLAGKVSEL